MWMGLQLEKLSQEQFEHILDLLICYRQMNSSDKVKNVYLSEKSIKEAIHFMNTVGNDIASKLGMSGSD